MDETKNISLELEKYCNEKNAYLFKENIQISFSIKNRLVELNKIRLDSGKAAPFARIKKQNNAWDLYFRKGNGWTSPKEFQEIPSIINALILIEKDNNNLFW